MASISSRRLATWTFSMTARSRTIGLSYMQAERPHKRITHQEHTRTFHTAFTHRQAAATAAESSPSPPRPAFNQNPTVPRAPPPPTARQEAANPPSDPIREYSRGLSDALPDSNSDPDRIDWTRSFHGLGSEAFSREAADILMQPLNEEDIEIKADGIIYLPEIKYRRILNKAFGPGGWGLAPRGETIVTSKSVTREYGLVIGGRLVSIARGEQDYFDPEGIPTATEGCKSNALMRCCKDLGVASELWDPKYIRKFMARNAKDIWVEHVVTRKRKKIVMRKDDEVRYPFKEVKSASG